MAKSNICAIDCCDKIKHAHIYCSSHYLRFKRHGDPLAGGSFRTSGGKQCSVDGCENMSVSHDCCPKHMIRLKRYGDPTAYGQDYRKRRKWVEEHSSYEGDECLKWPFSVSAHGRGTVTVGSKTFSAPKYMCTLSNGEPPTPSHQAAHSCGKGHEGCMNPNHLRWATAAENKEDQRIHGTLRQGSDINTSKLTEEKVRDIRRRVGSERVADLVKEFGVRSTTIYAIRDRKTWRWLE